MLAFSIPLVFPTCFFLPAFYSATEILYAILWSNIFHHLWKKSIINYKFQSALISISKPPNSTSSRLSENNPCIHSSRNSENSRSYFFEMYCTVYLPNWCQTCKFKLLKKVYLNFCLSEQKTLKAFCGFKPNQVYLCIWNKSIQEF